MIRQMEAFAGGFMRRSKPDVAVLVGEFRDWLLREMGGELQRVEKRAVTAAVKKIDQRLRLASQAGDARFPAREYWADGSKQSEVALSIAGSQNLAYCALFFGYEWFLVSGFRALGGHAKLRPNQDKFWDRFGELLGRDPKPAFWEERSLRVARHARNSIAHTGGKAKPELVAEAPDLFVSEEGFISVRPTDNHALFRVLREKVDRFVNEMTKKLERPAAA